MFKFAIYRQIKVGKYENEPVAIVFAPNAIAAKQKFEQMGHLGNFLLLNKNTGSRMAIVFTEKGVTKNAKK